MMQLPEARKEVDMHHTKITQKERELIGRWKNEGVKNKEIARRLSRPVLTIRRELNGIK